MNTSSTVQCPICETSFRLPAWRVRRGAKYCSDACRHLGKRTPLQERFWLHLERGADCWEWQGNKTMAGYGTIRRTGKTGGIMYAHRLSWEIHYGAIPPGAVVCHRCDNPPCVRPDHLFIGTQADNMADMYSKGRCQPHGPENPIRGSAHKLTRLSDEQVREIRTMYSTRAADQRSIASLFGISQSSVSAIVLRKRWSHLD
jgi:hypothetical protein